MTLTVYEDLEQGSDEWMQARAGIVTASIVGQLIAPSQIKPANNETSRGLIMQLAAERITGIIEETQASADMERGLLDEPYARDLYHEHYAPVEEVGFMVLQDAGVKLGYSPDGLVGDDGLIEIKSRKPKKHLQTLLSQTVPTENMAQIQAGLLVSGRDWCDYISYSGGLRLYVQRVYPDETWQNAIQEAVESAELAIRNIIAEYTESATKYIPTERIDHFQEIEINV